MTKTVNCMHNTTLLTADAIMKAFKDIWKGLIKHQQRSSYHGTDQMHYFCTTLFTAHINAEFIETL